MSAKIICEFRFLKISLTICVQKSPETYVEIFQLLFLVIRVQNIVDDVCVFPPNNIKIQTFQIQISAIFRQQMRANV